MSQLNLQCIIYFNLVIQAIYSLKIAQKQPSKGLPPINLVIEFIEFAFNKVVLDQIPLKSEG